jgi:hypothetical protein
MMATKSEVKSEIAVLTGKINSLDTNITTQMKSLGETVSAQISVLNANLQSRDAHMESRLDKFENRFLFRMLFAVSGPRIYYILLSNSCEGTWFIDSFIPTIRPDFYRQASYRPDS